MIVVTGGAGFIGSRIVKGLNDCGRDDILVVDDLSSGHKFSNIVTCNIADYLDKDHFIALVSDNSPLLNGITAIFHQGACSDTTQWDGRFMMKNNYEYSKLLLHFCLKKGIQFLYASSAAVYGKSKRFEEQHQYERPLNVYGYSKYLFDQYVRRLLPTVSSQVVGLRYFNVYGPYESHKGQMASIVYHHYQQLKTLGVVKLFAGCDGYGPGEQRRDFVYIDDVVNVNLWFWQRHQKSGIFNVGSGCAHSFNDLAGVIINWHNKGTIQYIPFPPKLYHYYQSFTQADLTYLQKAGYTATFEEITTGVSRYLDILNSSHLTQSEKPL